LVVSRQVLNKAERNIRQKLPRSSPNIAEQMAHLKLEILPNPALKKATKWESMIEAKTHQY